MRQTTRFKSVMAAALLASVVAACGSPASPPAAQAPNPPPAPAAAAPSAEPVMLDVRDVAGAQLSGNPQTGARIYRTLCRSCHAVTAGMNGTGPSLHGVVGRTAGTVEGFSYSEANRTSGIVWTEQEIFIYLERPMARIPNTSMVFQGISQPQQRADLIAYLSLQTE